MKRSTTRQAAAGRMVVLPTPSPTRTRTVQEKQALQRGLTRNEALRTALGRRG
jgi:hypothetical protein